MSSRDVILEALRRNRPPPEPLPEVERFDRPDGDLAARFAEMVREIGGQAEEVAPEDVAAAVAARYGEARTVASAAPDRVAGTVPLAGISDPHELHTVDLLVCEGTLGVAENGAVWLAESQMEHRAAPFLAQHLALVLERHRIVWNMHEAYARLRVDAEGFGAFIAGPSKTADIEQSLVIGAHGPRSLTVFLVEDGN